MHVLCACTNVHYTIVFTHQLASLGEVAPGLVLVNEEMLMKITVSTNTVNQWIHDFIQTDAAGHGASAGE